MANMVGNARSWAIGGGIGISLALVFLKPSTLVDYLDPRQSNGRWRWLGLLLALVNLKSLPFIWHLRLLNGLLAHLSFSKSHVPKSPGPEGLFLPVITSSSTSLWEMDYNLHKSNSTYFSDFDVSRMHLICALMKKGFYNATHKPTPSQLNHRKFGRLGVMLGGVTCSFRREVKPFEGYEIWTRVLSWDKKWLYLISHMVKKGSVNPQEYIEQPWRKSPGVKALKQAPGVQEIHPAIFATSVAKYVFKHGRLTIPPEVVLIDCELLPTKPAGLSSEPTLGQESTADGLQEKAALLLPESAEKPPTNHPIPQKSLNEEQTWDWARCERKRAEGYEIASHMHELDAAQYEFTGEREAALGSW